MGAARKLITFGGELSLCEPARRIVEPTPAEIIALNQRRPTGGRSRGRAGGIDGWQQTPLTTITSVPIAFFYDSTVLSQSGTVSSWTDLSGNSRHAVQATAGKRPAYAATDAAFGGKPSVTFDGVDDELVTTVPVPAPGTTPCYYFLVFMTITWTNLARVCGAPVATHLVYMNIGTPQLNQYNGAAVNANTNAAVGSARAVEAYFSNSTNDFLNVGSVASTGGNALNGSSTSWAMGSESGANFSNVAFAAALRTDGLPTASERAALKTWASLRYGSVVLT